MNNYLTRLRNLVSLASVFVVWLICFCGHLAKAQLASPICPSAKIFTYNYINGVRSDGNVGATSLTGGVIGTSPNVGTLAAALANGNALGATDGAIIFKDPANKKIEFFNPLLVNGLNYFEYDDQLRPIKGNVPPFGILTQTPHAGETTARSNPKFIDFADNEAVLLDDDNSLSLYSYVTKQFLFDYTWTTFTGGSLDGQAPSKANIDAIEDGFIYHMNGNDMEYYNIVTGIGGGLFVANPVQKTFFDGPLVGIGLGAAVSGGPNSPNGHCNGSS